MAKVLDYAGLDYVAEKIYGLVNAGSGADYIAEQGTSGIWTYRKWASGIAECWGVITTTITQWDAWNGLYEGKPVSKASFPTGLFIDTPVITATMDSRGQGLITTEVYLSASKDSTQEFYPVRPSAGQTDKELLVSVMAKGFWKTFTPNAIKSATLDTYYPVGSIYMTVNNVNPANLFGGTWEQIKDKFLLSAGNTYTAGTTGGEATHTLTTTEMPSHSHGMQNHTHTVNGGLFWTSRSGAVNDTMADTSNMSSGSAFFNANKTSNGPSNNTTTNSGSGGAHNNMPPYLTVYVWKRTA